MEKCIIDYLKKKGYNNISDDYYNEVIDPAKRWWKGKTKFHDYHDQNGQKREMYSLNMAETICDTWSSELWSEEDEIKYSKKNNIKVLDELKEEFDLENNIPDSIVKACYSGTCGAIVRIKKAKVVSNKLVADENTTRELVLVDAKHVIPLRIEHGKIVDVAFKSNTIINNQKYIYLEVHLLKENGYEISNVYFDKDGNEVQIDSVISNYSTGSKTPLFSLLTPPKTNKYKNSNGLGRPIYDGAYDQLKNCDINYHNYVMDTYLGGKKLIYNKKLIKYETVTYKEDGVTKTKEVPIYPDDVTKQQFMEIGDESTVNDKEMLHEYNPKLRVEENVNNIQESLDLLSFKSMLGTRTFNFKNGVITTATEYIGDRQDLVKNAKKFRKRLDKFITSIIEAGMYLSKEVFNEKVNLDEELAIENVDGFMVDQETIRREAREDLSAGVISKVEYRMKIYGEDEETAKQKVAEINQQYQLSNVSAE